MDVVPSVAIFLRGLVAIKLKISFCRYGLGVGRNLVNFLKFRKCEEEIKKKFFI